jgi:hypothetical protein
VHSRKKRLLASFLATAVIAVFLSPPCAFAADVSLHGFFQGNYSANTAHDNPGGGDFKLAEERVQLQVEGYGGPFHLYLKEDAFYDHVQEEADQELREGYLDYSAASWDVRLGRQVLTWGVGDLIFINDVFPKDFAAFFSGRPLEYLKKGVDGARVGWYPGFANFVLVVVPFFEPDTGLSPSRFSMMSPVPPTVVDIERQEPRTSLENTEVALRAYRNLLGFDASLYYYRGFFRQASVLLSEDQTSAAFVHPKVSVYGASLQGNALGGVLSLEGAYYRSREDEDGDNPFIPNSQSRFLLGYQRQLTANFTASAQYYLEYMHDFSDYERTLPPGFPRADRLSQLATLRLTELLFHQTLVLSFFSFYSPSDGDYLLIPEVKYHFSDHVWAALGANVFGGGGGTGRFGRLDENDNVYVQLRYEF